MIYQPTSPLTMHAAKAALAEGLSAIASGATEVDLARVPAVDSATVALLLAWHRAALARGATLNILNASAALSSLAKMYSVYELLNFKTASTTDVTDKRH